MMMRMHSAVRLIDYGRAGSSDLCLEEKIKRLKAVQSAQVKTKRFLHNKKPTGL